MLRPRPRVSGFDRLRTGCFWATLVFSLVTVGAVLGPSVSDAAQLTLTWTDTSSGQAGFRIERKIGSTGVYSEIAQQSPDVTSYADTTVASGTTYCYRVRAFSTTGTSDYSNEACRSLSSGFALTVAKSGTGAVASRPAGIACGTDCYETYASGTVVTLTPTPAPGARFTGWSGGGCTGTEPCVLAGNAPLTVSATFLTTPSPVAHTLTVLKEGKGRVISRRGGIHCGEVCSATYSSGTVVTLTARPSARTRFTGWNGSGCGDADTCTVTLDKAISVTATFVRVR